jgi:CTP synthase
LNIGEGTNFKKEKIEAIRFAKNNNTPILAISFGFNLAVMESLGISVEREKEVFSFIDNIEKGEIKVNIKKGTLAEQIYKNENNVYERNRYDSYLKPQFVKDLKSKGIILSGVEKRGRISIMELPRSPFYLAVKFHPEFKSRPNCPHPIFVKLLKIAILKNERKF